MPGEPPLRLRWRIEAGAFAAYSAVMRALPTETASGVGGRLLRFIGPLSGVEKTVQRNLRIAFPDLDAEARQRLSRDHWEGLGRTAAEFVLMDRMMAEGRVEVVGGERLHAIAASGKAAVMISGHFSNFEAMAAVFLAHGVKTQVTYRAANNPLMDREILKARARYGMSLFAPKGEEGTRALMKGMMRGESVALLVDQKYAEGLQVRFFDHPVMAAGGASRLAQRFGVPLQPISVERLGGARLRVTIHPPIPLPDIADRAEQVHAGTQAATDFIEAQVRARPSEWFWTHKRWPAEVYAALDAPVDG